MAQSRKLDFSDLTTPAPGQQSKKLDFSDLTAPSNESPQSADANPFVLTPPMQKGLLGEHAMDESFPAYAGEIAQGSAQGAREAVQNLKQLALSLANSRRVEPYQQEVAEQRQSYGKTGAAQNESAQLMRSLLGYAPQIATMAIPFLGEDVAGMSILNAMTRGGVGGAAAGAEDYAPKGDSRLANTIEGGAIGALIPGGLKAIDATSNAVKKAAGLSAAQQKLAEIGAPFTKPIEEAKTNLESLQNIEPEAIPNAQARLEEAKTAAQNAELAHQQNLTAQMQAKSTAAQMPGGSSDVNTLIRNTKIQEQKLQDIKNKSEALQEPVSTVGEAPNPNIPGVSTPTTETSKRIVNAEMAHNDAKNALSDIENNVSEFLKPSETHDVNFASRINEMQNKQREISKQNYNEIDQEFQDKNVNLSNPEDATKSIDEARAQIGELLKAGKSDEALRLYDKLEGKATDETMGARDYLASVRTVRDAAREARKVQYQVGLNEEARMAAGKQADALEDQHEKMMQILEDGVGKENIAKLKVANDHYRDNIAVLHRNPIYQQIRYGGKVNSADIAKSLRGTDKGMVYLRNLTKQDPEAMRNVVAQRYAANPENVYQPNDLLNEYINQMPELKNAISQRGSAQEAVSNAAQNVKMAQAQHKVSISEEKAQNTAQKQLEKDQAAYQKQQDQFAAEKERHAAIKQNYEAQAKEADEKIGQLKSHIDNLQDIAKSTGQSLKQKMTTQKELKEAKEAYSALTTGRQAEIRKAQQALRALESGKQDATRQAEKQLKEIEDARKLLWGRFKKFSGVAALLWGASKTKSLISKVL